MTSLVLGLVLIGQSPTQDLLHDLQAEINADYESGRTAEPRKLPTINWDSKTIPMALDYLEQLDAVTQAYHGIRAKELRHQEKARQNIIRKYRITESEFEAMVNTLGDDHRFRQLVTAAHLMIDVRTYVASKSHPTLHPGIARMAMVPCSCGTLMCAASAAYYADKIRYIDDISPWWSAAEFKRAHNPHDHDLDARSSAKACVKVLFFQKIDIKEIIQPEDPRYHNHEMWVRALVGGKTMFVQGRGLRNTEY